MTSIFLITIVEKNTKIILLYFSLKTVCGECL